jgi:hypothetical protein
MQNTQNNPEKDQVPSLKIKGTEIIPWANKE